MVVIVIQLNVFHFLILLSCGSLKDKVLDNIHRFFYFTLNLCRRDHEDL